MNKIIYSTYTNISVSYTHLDTQGKYEIAEPLYQKSLAIWNKILGDKHPNIAFCLNNLAGIYDMQGKYQQAESLYQGSLAIYEKALGQEHPSVGYSLNNLASLYYHQKQYDKSEPLYLSLIHI